MRHAVIMAGGTGTRLWPVSRQAIPKQFQKLIGQQTLLQQAYDRVRKILPTEQIWVMTGEQYKGIVSQQLPNVRVEHIITEPSARNTAPATALATLRILAEDPEAIMFGLVPADHYIGKEHVFIKTAKTAFKFIESNPEYIVTIGIHPSEPATGYGYIKLGNKLASISGQTVFKVDSFHEKPSKDMAEEYLESGQYLWNGGYFLFKGQSMIDSYKRIDPKLLSQITSYLDHNDSDLYEKLPKQPLDKTIIEHTQDLAVIPVEMQWSDIGDWTALHDILMAQGESSEIVTSNHIGNGSENTLVLGGSKLIATVGLKDLVVIDTDDVILICHKDSAQDVKKVVEKLQDEGKVEYL